MCVNTQHPIYIRASVSKNEAVYIEYVTGQFF